MPNVVSRILPERPKAGGQPSPVLQIVMGTFAKAMANGEDLLETFPPELRTMIFQELLIVYPKTVFRGANKFGPLEKNEYHEEVPIPWQILLTRRKYHDEAVPIMYGGNKLIFCTDKDGRPGKFWRFPIHKRHMGYLKDVGVYFVADNPGNQGSQRVAHFLKALTRLATNLDNLVVMVASDRYYEAACPWDILFCDHPVSKALDKLVQAQTVKHLKLRVHDGGAFYPQWARYINQTFYQRGFKDGHSITFSESCSCPCYSDGYCILCDWPAENGGKKPVELVVSPVQVEANQENLMDLQWELMELGLLPPKDDDAEDQIEDEDDFSMVDPYEEMRKAFDSGLLLDGQVRHWRSALKRPNVYSYRQTELTDFFKLIDYDQYLEEAFSM